MKNQMDADERKTPIALDLSVSILPICGNSLLSLRKTRADSKIFSARAQLDGLWHGWQGIAFLIRLQSR